MPQSIKRTGTAVAIAVIAATSLLGACSQARKPRLQYEERPVELLYQTGYRRMEERRWDDAVDYFQEVERQHPFSDWSRRAILMQIYAHYEDGQYQDAIAAADRFIQLYPGSTSVGYAFYMKAICNFEQITDVGRDQGYSMLALQGLTDVVRRFEGSAYATDAAVKIDMVNDQLAGKEMSIGRYYQRQNQLLAAANRYRTVIENEAYQKTSHTPEALYRLVEVYLALGLKDEAIRNGAVLGHNFPGSVWYSDAYELLSRDGSIPTDVPEAERKQNWFQRLIPGL